MSATAACFSRFSLKRPTKELGKRRRAAWRPAQPAHRTGTRPGATRDRKQPISSGNAGTPGSQAGTDETACGGPVKSNPFEFAEMPWDVPQHLKEIVDEERFTCVTWKGCPDNGFAPFCIYKYVNIDTLKSVRS